MTDLIAQAFRTVNSLDRIKLSYYLNGRTNTKRTENDSRECYFYLKGKCNKGNKCKFYHPKKAGQVEASTTEKGNTVQQVSSHLVQAPISGSSEFKEQYEAMVAKIMENNPKLKP